jgi:predicted AlkP superfamily phosphohydrolase/phosphomutase
VLPDRVLLTWADGTVVSCFVGPNADAGFMCPEGSGAATLSAFVGSRRGQVEVELDAHHDDACTTEVVNVSVD